MNSEAEHDEKYMAMLRALPPVGATTLNRMRDAAAEQASRIESFQLGGMMTGHIVVPWACQMRLRDDFVGIVRLIDNILGTPALLEQMTRRPPAKR